MEKYVVITKVDGEIGLAIKNTRELAELWEEDNECGYLEELKAFQYIDGKMEAVNVYEIAHAWFKERDEVEEEYRDYCETVEEYGYDYYEDQDQLEMGFNPYMGTYDYDC